MEVITLTMAAFHLGELGPDLCWHLSGTLNGTVPSLTSVVTPVLLYDKTRQVLFS